METNKIYKYLFFLTVAFYCFVLSQFGMENFDTGFISGYSWRIINGEIIYRDFLYKFPPTTIFLHAFFMKIIPEVGQFFYFRVISYLFFALQVFFVVSGFDNIYNLKKLKINKWGLMSVCFIISLLNFSPYPWPTTDGIFFAAFAFWYISIIKKPSFFKLFPAALFCLLSALSKQSFYLVPIVFLLWVYVRYNLKTTLYFLTHIIVLILILIKTILSITTWQNFSSQINGELRIHDLYYVGVYDYIFIPIKFFLIIISLLLILSYGYVYFTKQKIEVILSYLKWLSIVLIVISISLFFFKKVEIASRVAFDACVISLIYSFFYQKKTMSYLFPMIVCLLIAWSASISLGYQYPILFGTGIHLSYLTLMKEEINVTPKYYLWISFPLCLISISYNLTPYRETNIFSLNYSLESISPKLKFIKTGKDNYEKHLELKKLIHKYGENFIVAPSFPMANYLFNEQSELPTDWITEPEINRQYSKIIKLAAEKKNYVFLEKSFINQEDFSFSKGDFKKCPPKKFSYVGWFIYKNFNQIGETKHFIIYNSLKKQQDNLEFKTKSFYK